MKGATNNLDKIFKGECDSVSYSPFSFFTVEGENINNQRRVEAKQEDGLTTVHPLEPLPVAQQKGV